MTDYGKKHICIFSGPLRFLIPIIAINLNILPNGTVIDFFVSIKNFRKMKRLLVTYAHKSYLNSDDRD